MLVRFNYRNDSNMYICYADMCNSLELFQMFCNFDVLDTDVKKKNTSSPTVLPLLKCKVSNVERVNILWLAIPPQCDSGDRKQGLCFHGYTPL